MVKGHTQTLWVLMLEDRFSRLFSNLRFGGNKKELKSELKRVCSFQHLTSERQSIRFRLSLCYCHQWNIQLCIIHIRVEITQYLQNTTQIIWANQRREKKLGQRTEPWWTPHEREADDEEERNQERWKDITVDHIRSRTEIQKNQQRSELFLCCGEQSWEISRNISAVHVKD